MFFSRAFATVSLTAALALAGQFAAAQTELTADQIKDAFNKQKNPRSGHRTTGPRKRCRNRQQCANRSGGSRGIFRCGQGRSGER